MTIIDSSDPASVEESALWWMLTQRVAMTTAVCNELDSTDNFGNYRAKALLGHLRRWIADTFDSKSAWPDEGLNDLEVPEKHQAMLNECIAGAKVCKHFSMYWTADSSTELESDSAKIAQHLDEWRQARAAGFADRESVAHQIAPKGKHLYMVEHKSLGLRKIGVATSGERLDEWLRRGWTLLETIKYERLDDLRADEAVALHRLDQFRARSSTRMAAWFPNLTPDGRTEMYDPTCYRGTLRDLFSAELEAKLHKVDRVAPSWISEPRREAARKAHLHPGRDQAAAARKAVDSRRANQANAGPPA